MQIYQRRMERVLAVIAHNELILHIQLSKTKYVKLEHLRKQTIT